jgi:maltooligosyltrehalose trehalohydrolase
MLFMGEEWGSTRPWQFFTSFPDVDLGRAVSEGRAREFTSHGWDAADVPDPQDPATFAASRLDWSEPATEPHRSLLAWYRALIALRAAEPDLRDPSLARVGVAYDAAAGWLAVNRGAFVVVVNLAADTRSVPLGARGGEVVLAWDEAKVLGSEVGVPAESAAVVRLRG